VTPVSAGDATITATVVGASGTAAVSVTGFGGSYSMGSWTNLGIPQGTATIDPDSGPAAEVDFSYSVDLGGDGPGVPARAASFSVPVPRSGNFIFDWEFTGNHRFFETTAYLNFEGDGSTTVVDASGVGSSFSFNGTAVVAVSAGGTFVVNVGGGNNDSNSRINGNLKITNIRTP